MLALGINLVTVVLLVLSFAKSREKTKQAVQIGVKRGLALLPIMLGVLMLIGLLLAVFPPSLIQRFLGADMSGWQIVFATSVGSLAMIPSIISLPLAGSLIDSGASYTSIAAFVNSLTMVGFVTLPLEIKELGRTITLWRNLLAVGFAILIAIIMGVVL